MFAFVVFQYLDKILAEKKVFETTYFVSDGAYNPNSILEQGFTVHMPLLITTNKFSFGKSC